MVGAKAPAIQGWEERSKGLLKDGEMLDDWDDLDDLMVDESDRWVVDKLEGTRVGATREQRAE